MLNQKKPSKTITLTNRFSDCSIVLQKKFVLGASQYMDEEVLEAPLYQSRTVTFFLVFKRRVNILVAPEKVRKIPRTVVATVGGYKYEVHEALAYVKHLLEES